MGEKNRTKLIGYWIASLADEEYCAPQELKGTLTSEVRRKLASYLDAGERVNQYCGLSWCRYFCGVSNAEMGSGELTDGVWTWPEGLSHYVRAHGTVLPEEFVEHALANEPPQTAESSTDSFFSNNSPSSEFWREWCAARRLASFLKRLGNARAQADVQAKKFAEEYIRRRISQEINQYGLGSEACIYAGCHERALAGMKICALHNLGDTNSPLADRCYELTPEFLAGSFG